MNFQRITEQPISATQILFKTVFAGDEHSAKISGPLVRIMNIVFIKKGLTKTVTVKAKAKYGTVSPAEQSRTIRNQGFFFLNYAPPKDAKLEGKSDYITLQATYETGEVSTHRISMLLIK